jgi:hypothetical protein
MKWPFTALLLIASLTTFAQKAQNDPYIGKSKSQILVWFGQPEQTERFRKGEALTFRRVRKIEWNRRSPLPEPGSPAYDRHHKAERLETYKFFFDKKDVVYSWKLDTL